MLWFQISGWCNIAYVFLVYVKNAISCDSWKMIIFASYPSTFDTECTGFKISLPLPNN